MAVTRTEVDTKLRSKLLYFGTKLDGPTLKQATFYWSAADKYTELRNLSIEVDNISKHIMQTRQTDYQLSNIG